MICDDTEEEKKLLRAYADAAKRLYHDEGSVEIDDGAEVSKGSDEGAYVQAWVWVPADEIDLDTDLEELAAAAQELAQEGSPLWIETNEIPEPMRWVCSKRKLHHQRYYKGRWQLILGGASKDTGKKQYTLYDGRWPDVPNLTLVQALALADEKALEHG